MRCQPEAVAVAECQPEFTGEGADAPTPDPYGDLNRFDDVFSPPGSQIP
jgi:hypothetical protein